MNQQPANNMPEPSAGAGNYQSPGGNRATRLDSQSRWPSWLGYVATVFAEAAVTAGLVLLQPHLPLGAFPIPYVLVIMLIAYLFGGGPSLLAFVVGLLAFDYFFVPPLHTLLPHPATPNGLAGILAYLIGTLIVGFTMILIRRSKRRILQIADDLAASEDTLHKVNRTLKMLSQVNQIVIRASDESTLLNDVCQVIVDVGGYRMAWVGYTENDPEKTVRSVARAGRSETYPGTAGEPSIAIPLTINGQSVGSLNLYAGSANAFDDEEVRLLSELAGDLAYGIGSLRSREERTRVEEALKESEQRYRDLIEHSPDGIVVHSEGRIVFANAGAAEIMRAASPKDLIGKAVIDLVHPDYRDIAKERIRRIMDERKKSPLNEQRLIRLDGTVVDAEIVGIPITFEGKPAAIVVARDITERKMAEQRRLELEEHKRRFFRRTILAATEGKLETTDREEIERLAGPPIASWPVKRKEDPGLIRREVAAIAKTEGIKESALDDLVLCVGEATTNALKHAGGGTASLHRVTDGLMFVVSDRGPGIEALALPELALKRGYTTAGSLGVGYKAIISLADKVYLATGPGGTTVGIEISFLPAASFPKAAALPDTWNS